MVTGLQHSLLHKLYLLFYARRLNAVPMSIVSTEGKIFPCLEKLRGHYPCTCVGTQQKRGQSDTKGTKDHCTSDTRIYAKRKSGTVAPSHIQRPVHLLLIKWFFQCSYSFCPPYYRLQLYFLPVPQAHNGEDFPISRCQCTRRTEQLLHTALTENGHSFPTACHLQ